MRFIKELRVSFYSRQSVMFQINAFIILWLTMAIFWPKKSLAYYIKFGNAPLTFLVVFVMALTISSYLNLIFGRKEISLDGPWGDSDIDLLKKQSPRFIFDHLTRPIIQTLLLLLPLVPILLISAGISGLTIQESLKAISIIPATSLLCYFLGLLVYQIFQKRRLIGFFITRSFLICILAASGFLGAHVNPVLLMYGIHKGEEMRIGHSLSNYLLYMAITIFLVGLLTFANHVIMKYRNP